jgi:uncharacterized membrane protein YfcA
LAVILGVVCFASLVQLASGFGFALLCVPLLTLVVDAHLAVLIALLLGVAGTGYQALSGRRDFDRGVVARLLVAAFLGMPVGLYVYSRTSPQGLKIAVGALILASALLLLRGFSIRDSSRAVDLGVGLLTGFLTTSIGTSGPPVVAVLQARSVTAVVFRATASVVFCVIDVVAVAGFAARGDVTWPLVLLALCTLPGMLLGAWIGILVRPLLTPDTFRWLVVALLAGSGLTAIVTALS